MHNLSILHITSAVNVTGNYITTNQPLIFKNDFFPISSILSAPITSQVRLVREHQLVWKTARAAGECCKLPHSLVFARLSHLSSNILLARYFEVISQLLSTTCCEFSQIYKNRSILTCSLYTGATA